MNIDTIAGHAGRITGTTIRVAHQINSQIDWREVATIVVLGLVTMVALTWEAGFRAGRFVHDLNDALAREWVAALGVLERPAASTVEPGASTAAAPASIVWRPQPVAATWAAPIDRAVTAVRCGRTSQRQAARRYGVSRTSLQRALAAA